MNTTIVQFDKTYLDGDLAGVIIPGETCTHPDWNAAQRHAAMLQRVEQEGDFIRDCSTGRRYTVANVVLHDAGQLVL